jgi:hypothetical protein
LEALDGVGDVGVESIGGCGAGDADLLVKATYNYKCESGRGMQSMIKSH